VQEFPREVGLGEDNAYDEAQRAADEKLQLDGPPRIPQILEQHAISLRLQKHEA